MARLDWLDDYSVGVDEFDFHHKKIFSIIRKLRDHIESGKVNISGQEILDELSSYGQFHLEREEALFVKYNYKNIKEHIKFHDAYRAQILKFKQQTQKESINLQEVLEYLENWWLQHILNEDHKYTEFFHENNIY